MGPQGLLIKQEDAMIVTWVLNMQNFGLLNTLQHLKLKVIKVTQTKATSFQEIIKQCYQKTNIWLAKKLEVFEAKRFTKETCHTFYRNLVILYTQHIYPSNHIWNSNETRIQVGQQFGARVLARQCSHDVYNTILKS